MLKTGKETKLGQEIRIGDILKGKSTTYMLVMINTDYKHLGEYVTSTIDYKIKDTIFGAEKICTIKDNIFGP